MPKQATSLLAILRGGLRSKLLQSGVLAILVIIMLGADDSRFDRLGHNMICICGCNQILLECNHVGCPDSARMIGELRDQLASGATDTKILNWFAAKYGPVVLAAPMQTGFDKVAWITPVAVFLLATLGTAAIVWAWRRRTLRLAGVPASYASSTSGPTSPATDALRERIRRETEYR